MGFVEQKDLPKGSRWAKAAHAAIVQNQPKLEFHAEVAAGQSAYYAIVARPSVDYLGTALRALRSS